MDNLVKLKILGLSYSQIRQDAYALILSEENGNRSIPVVIGSAEAQSIALRLEKMTPPRPLTHDLFASFTHAFGIRLVKVVIYKFEDGVFYSEMTFDDGVQRVELDARTSDAVAVALRTGAPVYTYESILRQTGFVMQESSRSENSESSDDAYHATRGGEDEMFDELPAGPDPEKYTVAELEATLASLIEREEYEEAARISEILQRKRNK